MSGERVSGKFVSAQDKEVLNIEKIFREHFSEEASYVVRAPGRVNLIGEHTDYNEGFVLPVAIDRSMVIAARIKSQDEGSDTSGNVELYSQEYAQFDSFSLDNLQPSKEKSWTNYLRAVLKMYQNDGYSIPPFQAVLSGDVPQGAGLSSSAAYEVAVARLIKEFLQVELSDTNLALLAQRAENEFVGMNCGIMDQFISALGQVDSALMIDCRSLDYKIVPLKLAEKDFCIVITNSGVRRGLVESAYNERRLSCDEGVVQIARLLKRSDVKSLRNVSMSDLESIAADLSELHAKRCRHVISENERVLVAIAALEDDDFVTFGKLMNESHHSLQHDFEVSCPQVDTLVQLTQAHPGVLGSRITGAGFGGCTVTLMQLDAIDSYRAQVLPAYEAKTGCNPEIYVCVASAGASILKKP